MIATSEPRSGRRAAPSVGIPALALLFALFAMPWGSAEAVLVNLVLDSSLTGQVSMENATSPRPQTGRLDQLAAELGLGPTGVAILNNNVTLRGGAMSATFQVANPPPSLNTVVNTRVAEGLPPWESINRSVPLADPLQLVAQPIAPGGVQNLAIFGGDFSNDGLPGQQFFITGLVDNGGGGAISLAFNVAQDRFGFNIAGLDQRQPVNRFIYIDFFDEAGQLVDLLTVRVPIFDPQDTSVLGVSVLSFTSLTKFSGITITTDDPSGFGIGDFRYTPVPSTVWLILVGALGYRLIRQLRTRKTSQSLILHCFEHTSQRHRGRL